VYPNPYNREKAVRGTLKIEVPAEADIRIYNVETYKIFEAKGVTGRIEWDGKNMKGEKVAPGIYFYVVEMGGEKFTGRIFITK
jgi:flagellar hook assembly protein FlgD